MYLCLQTKNAKEKGFQLQQCAVTEAASTGWRLSRGPPEFPFKTHHSMPAVMFWFCVFLLYIIISRGNPMQCLMMLPVDTKLQKASARSCARQTPQGIPNNVYLQDVHGFMLNVGKVTDTELSSASPLSTGQGGKKDMFFTWNNIRLFFFFNLVKMQLLRVEFGCGTWAGLSTNTKWAKLLNLDPWKCLWVFMPRDSEATQFLVGFFESWLYDLAERSCGFLKNFIHLCLHSC